MTEPTVAQIQAALVRHASVDNEVFPSVLRLIAAEQHWSGRLWDVVGVLATDRDTMRYPVGGDRPDEIAECANRWADSGLSVEDGQLPDPLSK